MCITKTSSILSLRDKWGSIKVRWGIDRNVYTIEPGLYALGEPNETSPVIVTANYKLTFDIVRSNLEGLNIYILVLDTKGVNVWCAAGKGTFGTEELVTRIRAVNLATVVSHRNIILPQLGAVGVAAHDVKKQSGFKVIYGPVRAQDLPAFLQNDLKSTIDMRQVQFTLLDRLVLTPIELVSYAKYTLVIIFLLLLVSLIHRNGFYLILDDSINIVRNVILAYLAGTIATPILLPWIPVRSFSAKGAIVGFIIVLLLRLLITPWIFIIPAISSFLAMNFTGASTYTSLSGVKKEMKVAIPLQIIAMVVGVIGLVFINLIK